MKTLLPTRTQSRTVSLLLYALAPCLVLLAPALGLLVVAVAVWQALLAGSIWYLPLGLVLVLAAVAMVQSHKLFDLALLGLVIVSGVIVWFGVDAGQQDRVLNYMQALALQTGLMAGMLLLMVLALVLIHAARRSGRW